MLKVGYDHFELTKRPPKVDVCDRQYVFNQIPQTENASFNANAACPPASVPSTLMSAYSSYQKTWNQDFLKAVSKFDREEARKMEADEAKARAEAKRAAREAEIAARMEANGGQPATPVLSLFATGNPLKALTSGAGPAEPLTLPPSQTPAAGTVPAAEAETMSAAEAIAGQETAAPALGGVPVPMPNPAVADQPVVAQQQPQAAESDKPFWKIWSKN